MNNTEAHFAYIEKEFSLYEADNVVLSGTSAGAIAALSWSNFLYNQMKKPSGLVIAPDSGIMIFDYTNPFTGKEPIIESVQGISEIANKETRPALEECYNDRK